MRPIPDVKLAFIPDLESSSTFAFVRSICSAYDIPAKRSLHAQKETLKQFVYEQGTAGFNVVLLLDEAQGLTNEMFEIVRSFLNYESNNAKLIQIILTGQIELREKLKNRENRAIKSRVIMYGLLDPLSLHEMKGMIAHRCNLAQIPIPFTDNALSNIYEWSGGVPRDILKICSLAYESSRLAGVDDVPDEIVHFSIHQEERALSDEPEQTQAHAG